MIRHSEEVRVIFQKKVFLLRIDLVILYFTLVVPSTSYRDMSIKCYHQFLSFLMTVYVSGCPLLLRAICTIRTHLRTLQFIALGLQTT